MQHTDTPRENLQDVLFAVKGSEEGTKYHLEIPPKKVFYLNSLSLEMTEETCNANIYFENENDDEEIENILICKLNRNIPSSQLCLPFELDYLDFVVKGKGTVHFVGFLRTNPNVIDYNNMEIIEDGFKL